MNKETDYITEEKRKDLEGELSEMKTVKRKEIVESLEFAKSLGDLSENAEYQQAREDQAKLEERISEIEKILKSAVVISKNSSSEVVEIGSSVSVQKKGGDENTFHIVGSEEADMEEGKISNKSPLGEALFDKREGDVVFVKGPNKDIEYKILKVN